MIFCGESVSPFSAAHMTAGRSRSARLSTVSACTLPCLLSASHDAAASHSLLMTLKLLQLTLPDLETRVQSRGCRPAHLHQFAILFDPLQSRDATSLLGGKTGQRAIASTSDEDQLHASSRCVDAETREERRV